MKTEGQQEKPARPDRGHEQEGGPQRGERRGAGGGRQDVIRIGHFEYLNGYPLYYGLEKGEGWGCFELVHGVPTELNRLLLAGELDISPVSSIEYAAHDEDLLLFPRVSITTDGAVDSIILVSNRRIEKIESVALTGHSATSVVLLKILMKQAFGCEPAYVPLEGDYREALKTNDAVLLIGDQALKACYSGEWKWGYNLGAGWKDFTGLPMVFAVWAVRRSFFAERPDETREVEERLIYSVEQCRGNWDEVVAAAAEVFPFEPSLLRSYFDQLRYDFNDVYRQGLEEFYRLAVDMGEIARVPEIKFI